MILLDRLSIGTRILVGFGSMIAITLTIAGVGHWGLGYVGNALGNMGRQSVNAGHVNAALDGENKISELLLRAGATPVDDLRAKAAGAFSQVREALISVRSTTPPGDRLNTYVNVLGRLDDQAKGASASFDLAAATSAGRDRLLVAGEKMSAATNALVSALTQFGSGDARAAGHEVDRDILLLRTATLRFMVSPVSAGVVAFNANLQKVAKDLNAVDALGLTALHANSAALRASQTEYSDAFAELARATIALSEIYDKVQLPLLAEFRGALGKAQSGLTQTVAGNAQKAAGVQNEVSLIQMITAGAGVVTGLLLAFFVGRSISRPIRSLTETMRSLAGGDRTVVITSLNAHNEIGDMSRALDFFKSGIIDAARLSAEQRAQTAARSRRQDAMDRHTMDFSSSVTGVMAGLGAAAENLRVAANVMTESTSAMHKDASGTAEGAKKSSAELIAVSAAVEEFTASVGEIARQVSVAAEVASQAVARAEAGQATIQSLAASTARIGDVVRLIDSIAGQTNLLALNATIESARAGDAGKGFAVVAGEVKLLAGQTAKATAEISEQIASVRAATDETVTAMSDIGAIIGRMGEVSTAISAAIEEQSVTVREIAHSIQGVAGSTAQAAEAMDHVVHDTETAGGASRNILSEANGIGAEAERLRNEVETFLQAVQSDERDRRQFERLSGQGVTVALIVGGARTGNVTILDISQSGIALLYAPTLARGQSVEIELPLGGGTVTGRVVRSQDGALALAFAEDNTTFARVERIMVSLSAEHEAA